MPSEVCSEGHGSAFTECPCLLHFDDHRRLDDQIGAMPSDWDAKVCELRRYFLPYDESPRRQVDGKCSAVNRFEESITERVIDAETRRDDLA